MVANESAIMHLRQQAAAITREVVHRLKDKYQSGYYSPDRGGSPYRSTRHADDVVQDAIDQTNGDDWEGFRQALCATLQGRREHFAANDVADPDGYVCAGLNEIIRALEWAEVTEQPPAEPPPSPVPSSVGTSADVIVAPDPPGPYRQFHEARMTWVGHFLGIVPGLIPLAYALYVLLTSGWPINDGGWFLIGLWLAIGIPFSWAYAQTLGRIAAGKAAGVQVAETDDYLEIVFFADRIPCWEKRFLYAEIVDHGMGKFDSSQSARSLPYVSTRGTFRQTVRNPISLWAFCDLRRLHPIHILAIAADVKRIVGRHPTG